MARTRIVGLLALLAPLWFLGVYLTMSSLHPEYSHLTKAISELGSVDAPNALAWNVFGYGVSGAIVGLLGLALLRHFSGQKGIWLPGWSLVASGFLMVLSGVFPGDFNDRTSFTMIIHAIGSFGSFVCYLICGFGLPMVMRRSNNWRPFVWPSVIVVVASIASGFLRSGNAPGFGQRLGFACFFVWVGLVGFGLCRIDGLNASTTKSAA